MTLTPRKKREVVAAFASGERIKGIAWELERRQSSDNFGTVESAIREAILHVDAVEAERDRLKLKVGELLNTIKQLRDQQPRDVRDGLTRW